MPGGVPTTGPVEPVFVPGEPALLLTAREQKWRAAVQGCGLSGLSSMRLRFVVSSWRRRGHPFDLDNLVDPVIAEVAAPPAQRRSLWATVEVGVAPGVGITSGPPPPTPGDALRVHLRNPPRRSARTEDRLAELVDAVVLGTEEACGCALVLGGDTKGLVFGFEGPVKPTLDALWPLLGGTAHRPADHRITDLRVQLNPGANGIAVALWPLVRDAGR